MNIWTEHPKSVGETYIEHCAQARWFAGQLFLACFTCLIHGFFPFLYTSTASYIVEDLGMKMTRQRRRGN